jgi:uncharacterized protein
MNKKILPLIIVFIIIFSYTIYGEAVIPNPTNTFYVNDFANVIDNQVETDIVTVNKNYEKTKEKPQIVIVTVNNMQGMDENSFAIKLIENWKIGNREYDNGILVLLAIEERRIKIEVGYGLEGAVTDSEAGRILDSSINYLSNDNYSAGINNIFIQLAKQVNEEYGYNDDDIFKDINVNNNQPEKNELYGIGRILTIIIILIILNIFRGGPGRRRRSYFIPPTIHRIGGFGGGFSRGGGFGGGGRSFGGGGRSGGGGAGRGF